MENEEDSSGLNALEIIFYPPYSFLITQINHFLKDPSNVKLQVEEAFWRISSYTFWWFSDDQFADPINGNFTFKFTSRLT